MRGVREEWAEAKEKRMTDQEINQAIAEHCGWVRVKAHRDYGWQTEHWHDPKDECFLCLPDYCSDLNAMADAINALPSDGTWDRFVEQLKRVCHWDVGSPTVQMMLVINATARQRAEAFLRTLGKWHETATPTTEAQR
jgi:hypothetical protein